MRINFASGQDVVTDHLQRGLAIAVPGPKPFPYVVVGFSAAAVNEAKGRPADQPAVLIVDDLERVAPFISLDAETLSYARWLTASKFIHLFVPVKGQIPPWAEGATSKTMLGVSMAWHPDLRALLKHRGYLFASSANITGDSPIGTAAEVDKIFKSKMLVIDDDSTSIEARAISGMIVSVKNGLVTDLVRPGFQNEHTGQSPEDFVAGLPSLWRSEK